MSHVGTDFDGLASMVLAQKLYPGSQLVFPGRQGTNVREFYDLHKRHFPALELSKALARRPDRIIVVDTRTPSRLGGFREWVHDSEVELHVYDHHPPTAESVRGDQEWVEPVGAAATLLVERCQALQLPFKTEEASLALLAIHEETGSFRYSSTTARDLRAAAYLMEQGANLEVVCEFLKDPLTEEQRDLLEEFLRTGRFIEGGGGRLLVSCAVRERSVYGLGGLATRVLEMEDCEAVCLVLEVEGEGSTMAARSASDRIDVAAWMALWGGGGHPRAAAASRIPESATAVCDKLASLARTTRGVTLTAADVMSRELFTIDLGYTVEQAYRELQARGFHSACVLDGEGQLQGLVTRTDLSRALEHELGHAPARSVMTHKVVSVRAEDTLDQVRRLVVERHVGSLPVLEDGELVGIVTRTDLLREMYQETELEGWDRVGAGQRVSLAGVGEPNLTRIKAAAGLAAREKVRIYVVGGFVRDLLLGRPHDDLDLVAEGDAIALARALQRELGGKLVAHEKYMTASLRFSDDDKLDIATARREVYVRPAALPEVAESKLKSDLYRRDFTINALALRLSDNLTGVVIDFFGGRQDLDGKKVRVLHNHSFFDDPTRILRAVRFEQRLGFSIEPHTQQLIGSALDADIFRLANPDRLAEELRLSLSEHDPVKVLDRLERMKVLKAINPELRFQHKARERTAGALEFMACYPGLVRRSERWRVPLEILGLALSSEGRRAMAERFGWTVAKWPVPIKVLIQELSRKPLSHGEVGELLDKIAPTQLAVLAGFGSHPTLEERLRHYVENSMDMVPLLSGHDILAEGVSSGPRVAVWKRKALAAQRDGRFADRKAALEWLRDALRGED